MSRSKTNPQQQQLCESLFHFNKIWSSSNLLVLICELWMIVSKMFKCRLKKSTTILKNGFYNQLHISETCRDVFDLVSLQWAMWLMPEQKGDDAAGHWTSQSPEVVILLTHTPIWSSKASTPKWMSLSWLKFWRHSEWSACKNSFWAGGVGSLPVWTSTVGLTVSHPSLKWHH